VESQADSLALGETHIYPTSGDLLTARRDCPVGVPNSRHSQAEGCLVHLVSRLRKGCADRIFDPPLFCAAGTLMSKMRFDKTRLENLSRTKGSQRIDNEDSASGALRKSAFEASKTRAMKKRMRRLARDESKRLATSGERAVGTEIASAISKRVPRAGESRWEINGLNLGVSTQELRVYRDGICLSKAESAQAIHSVLRPFLSAGELDSMRSLTPHRLKECFRKLPPRIKWRQIS
jgi:hypothetical protein